MLYDTSKASTALCVRLLGKQEETESHDPDSGHARTLVGLQYMSEVFQRDAIRNGSIRASVRMANIRDKMR